MCLRPISINVEQSNPNAPPFHRVLVPCGNCEECVAKYQNSWTIRIIEELKNWPKSIFVTLTYNPENVPLMVQKSTGEVHLSVNKKHVQDWIKLFRTRYKREYGIDANFKYFFCAEYGPTTLRPHYHGIIFGMSKSDFHLALSDWRKKYGFVRVDDIDTSTIKSRMNTARYVAHYCLKGSFENYLVAEGKVLPVFRLMSKGLGSSYVLKHKDRILNESLGGSKCDDIIDKLKYTINDFVYALPRYYKDKILPPKSRLRYKVADTLLARNDEIYRTKLRQVQSELALSETEATNYLVMQEIDANKQRAIDLKERQNKFLKKSKV